MSLSDSEHCLGHDLIVFVHSILIRTCFDYSSSNTSTSVGVSGAEAKAEEEAASSLLLSSMTAEEVEKVMRRTREKKKKKEEDREIEKEREIKIFWHELKIQTKFIKFKIVACFYKNAKLIDFYTNWTILMDVIFINCIIHYI